MQSEQPKQKALELLAKLGEAHGAPGNEDSVRRIFYDEIGSDAYTDRTGNIFFEKTGTMASPRIMLTAHMDEVGFVVQSIAKNGLIKFLPLGGWWSHTLLAHRVRVRTRAGTEVVGVIGAKPPHLLNKNEREKVVDIEDMFIDVGAMDKDEVRDRFRIAEGDTIVPDSRFTQMSNPNLLLCKGFDNRVGIALTIQSVQMIKEDQHASTIYAAGTVQEEVGVRGARTAVFGVNPDAAIVLEGAPADDLPAISEDERQGVLGRGVQIRLMDPSAIMSRKFTQYVVDLAETHQISYQVAVRKSGGTDARAIQLHASGVPAVVLAVPARYIHTHNCIVHMDDYLSTLNLVVELLKRLDRGTVDSFTNFLD